MGLDRDPAAVVLDGDAAVDVDRDRDVRAVPGQGFVDRVVHDLEHEVMEPPLGRVPDVHPGAFPNGLETLENLDVFRAVLGRLCLSVTHGSIRRIENTKLYRWIVEGATFIGAGRRLRGASA
jgi:hypothetical protein